MEPSLPQADDATSATSSEDAERVVDHGIQAGFVGKLHPLWRKNLQNALRENQTLPNCRFVQLSTMRINGTPASRTIVFRGFLEDPKGDPSSVLWFVGDLRTEKAEQVDPCAHMLKILAMLRLIASQVLYPNRGELIWTFPLSKEVFRLQGCLDVVVHGEEDPLKRSYRFMAWSSLHADSRLKYNWAAPGMQLNVAGFSLINGLWVPEEEGEDDRAVKGGEMAELAKSSSHLDGVGAAGIPSPQFCLMTLEPDSVQIERLGEGRKFWFKLEQGGKSHDALAWHCTETPM